MSEEIYKRALEREKNARKIAENLLEDKSRALYISYLQLKNSQTALNAQNKLLQGMLNSSHLSIIATQLDGTIILFNPSAEKLLDYRAIELIGEQTPVMLYSQPEIEKRAKDLSQLLQRPIIPGFETLTAMLDETDVDEREWNFIKKDGSAVLVLSSFTALHDTTGEIDGYLCVAQDISERKKVEKLKREFISIVSHELRTPLTAIRGSLGLMKAGVGGELSDKNTNLLEMAGKNCDRLIVLINDILDLEKMESDQIKFNLKSISLREFLTEAVNLNQAYGERFNVRYILKDPLYDAPIEADFDRFMQVMTNLMSNAAKFSPAGAEIEISTAHMGEFVRISVTDHGAGIPPEFFPYIFGKFAQADNSSNNKKPGTGLGLCISKTIVEKLGGKISFESEIDKGTTFNIDFPHAQAT